MRWFSYALIVLGLWGCQAPKKIISFRTPEETFATWRSAVETLDYELLLQCYATPSVSALRSEIQATSQDGLKAMRDESRRTDYKIEKVVYEDKRAFVRVKRQLEKSEEIEILTMIQEGGNWKLLP